MLVRTHDIARACVAATSLRRHHPAWFQWLFVHDALPAPWEDFACGVFDARMVSSELPPRPAPAGPTPHGKPAARPAWPEAAWLERGFAALFEAGAETAVYLDTHHVWMKPSPSLEAALERHDIVVSNAGLIAVRRATSADRLSAALAGLLSSETPHAPGTASDVLVLDDAGFGLDHARLETLPLRFAPDGSLRQGDQPVTTVNFRNSAMTESEARCGLPALGTEWVELTKWYASELRRFGGAGAAAHQLSRSQPG